jgi:hypothetical protein
LLRAAEGLVLEEQLESEAAGDGPGVVEAEAAGLLLEGEVRVPRAGQRLQYQRDCHR